KSASGATCSCCSAGVLTQRASLTDAALMHPPPQSSVRCDALVVLHRHPDATCSARGAAIKCTGLQWSTTGGCNGATRGVVELQRGCNEARRSCNEARMGSLKLVRGCNGAPASWPLHRNSGSVGDRCIVAPAVDDRCTAAPGASATAASQLRRSTTAAL
uniref:Uncharacterized protein n=1 Tax=Aegilops tauschii subsp. strangulata TaxID=200361 RepID=A0A453JIJ4_AEGTS